MTEQHGQLGVQVEYPRHYAPDVLYPIERRQGRAGLGMGAFCGRDVWNLWELSWLGSNGVPVVATGQLKVPADSPNMVESKSLKLYFNSLNQSQFDSPQAFQECVETDLARCIGTSVELSLYLPDNKSVALTESLETATTEVCIDQGTLIGDDFASALVALIKPEAASLEQHWVSHVFRSLCPVTGQPDWARIDVRVVGAEMDPNALLSYLVAYRNHGGFHEQCVEKIWTDLQRTGGFSEIEVLARFTRRGGIDICPYRVSANAAGKLEGLAKQRAFRQ